MDTRYFMAALDCARYWRQRYAMHRRAGLRDEARRALRNGRIAIQLVSACRSPLHFLSLSEKLIAVEISMTAAFARYFEEVK
jgi:hypothetical protein